MPRSREVHRSASRKKGGQAGTTTLVEPLPAMYTMSIGILLSSGIGSLYRQRISSTSSTKPSSVPEYIERMADRKLARSWCTPGVLSCEGPARLVGSPYMLAPKYRNGIKTTKASRYRAAQGSPRASGMRGGITPGGSMSRLSRSIPLIPRAIKASRE